MALIAILRTCCIIPWDEVQMLMDPINTIVFLHIRRFMDIHDMGVEIFFRIQFSTFFTIATMTNFSYIAQWTGICFQFTFLFMHFKLRNTMVHSVYVKPLSELLVKLHWSHLKSKLDEANNCKKKWDELWNKK